MKARYISKHIGELTQSKWGRILVVTGARQTGKTTFVKQSFPDYTYISIEDPVMRPNFTALTASQWNALYPKAILDEIQKEPVLIESIKSVYDQWDTPRYILLGSSQLLLMNKVKESLAGRCIIQDLFPLTVPELETDSWDNEVADSPFQQMVMTQTVPKFYPSLLLDANHPKKIKAWQHYVTYGGYPALSDEQMSEDDRFKWLQTYVRTYLERDVRDLASFKALEPYMKLQQLLALQTGNLCNASSLGAHINVSSKTVQRYLQYLEISYQTLSLPAWARNAGRRLVKSPKIHYLDNGVLQAVLKKRSAPSGSEFESLVIAEMYKQVKQTNAPVSFYHLRTNDGREVDCLIETSKGYYAFEIKQAEHVQRTDARHLVELASILDKPLLHSFVLSNDVMAQQLDNGITALNVIQFLG
ncbi:MAG: AAA family ATPase [Muribaculaceae bacterium]|jgi:predicted AAA+ superfamily ATPase|nr:AAA family ATPase [Muribaculaceae bacterium]